MSRPPSGYCFRDGHHSGQESIGVVGHVIERQPALVLFGAAVAEGDEAAEASVGGAVGCPEDDGRGVGGRDLAADGQLEIQIARGGVRRTTPARLLRSVTAIAT